VWAAILPSPLPLIWPSGRRLGGQRFPSPLNRPGQVYAGGGDIGAMGVRLFGGGHPPPATPEVLTWPSVLCAGRRSGLFPS
jgi:hypothetical protein